MEFSDLEMLYGTAGGVSKAFHTRFDVSECFGYWNTACVGISCNTDIEPSSGEEGVEAPVWWNAMMGDYDVRETVPKPIVESMIDSMHAIVDDVLLEQGKYTLKILEDQDEEGITCFGENTFLANRDC
jgi:hypothetical protein